MRLRLFSFALLLGIASPALADRLVFDHRLSPPLKAALDSGDPAMVSYDNANPHYVVDVIAVRGASARDWTEALVIIARSPDRKVATVSDWVGELQQDANRHCRAVFTPIAEDAISQTFERRSTGCPAGYPPVGLYRVVKGQTSLFLLAAMAKDDLAPPAREQWLALLRSAHLE